MYPEFEVLFSVADHRDPACALVESLIKKYPNVDARLMVGAVDIGPNPKVNNMMNSYNVAKYDHILISDSNIRVNSDYLVNLVPDLDEDTGIVSGVVVGESPAGFGGRMEQVFLNTFIARWMILGSWAGFPTVIGKSMFFRREVAQRFGGIQNLARFLAEDYMAGQAMLMLGLKVKHMTQPIPQIIGKHTFNDFWQRHVRWGRIRKVSTLLPFLGEPLNGPIASGLLGAYACHALFGVAPLQFIGLHIAGWFMCDLVTMLAMKAEISYATPLFWALRELSQIPQWAHILSGDTVNWRGRQLKLEAGGVLVEPDAQRMA
ncbi:MAG: glycosyltransferase [Deltaproteobacteria bacterium]|nr:glycosyltransferase [Deltaproteobacteria bacterium]